MANYPSFGQDISSVETILDDLQVEYSSNGTLKRRILYSAPKREFSVVHTLNIVDRSTLDTFYTTNRLVSFNFTWVATGTSYTCVFKSPPQYSMLGGGFFSATVTISEV